MSGGQLYSVHDDIHSIKEQYNSTAGLAKCCRTGALDRFEL